MLPYPLLLFLVIGASAFQVKEQLPEEFLLGGMETSFGQFPAAAYIVSPERELCGATVLNANHVLTLAQCVLNATHNTINPRLVRVHAGVLDLDSVSPHRQTRLGDVIFVHPNFKAHSLENDVAVIRIQQPFIFPSNEVEPASRRTRIVANGASCSLVGWGSIATGPVQVVNHVQRVISLTVKDRDMCSSLRRDMPVFENMICAGYTTNVPNGPAPCQGSLGSGLYCHGDLTGLLSFGINCGAANNPPTFTQVRFYNPWIEQQLVRNDRPPAGFSPLDVV
ncbi:AAEL015104-PA [Aedes aegypti]|uniref:AAEL015104-PA n=1 Tax=Aedes aegypti TaxID=7159 RepID=Q16EM1_AEDAE|nr:AAEL015104-PA [Aedes aegypti]